MSVLRSFVLCVWLLFMTDTIAVRFPFGVYIRP